MTVDGDYICQIAQSPRSETLDDFDDLTIHNQKTHAASHAAEDKERAKLTKDKRQWATDLVHCFNLVYFPDEI